MTPVNRKPSLDFSLTGLVYTAIMLFMGLAAINTQANLLFGVFGLMIGVLLVSWSLSRIGLRRLSVVRELPDFAVVGQGTTITYRFTNAKRFWASLSVTIAELDGVEAFVRQPLAYMLHAAPGMTAVVPTEVIPKRRGLFTLERCQISTSFPFGFVKRAAERRQKDTIIVHPAVGQVEPKLLALCKSAERSGAMMRPRRGGNDEFFGMKEFRTGENPRWIDWRRSARTGTLVSREMTQVAPPRLLLLVDTCEKDGSPGERALIEKTIAMAGSLASHALEAGLMVGLYYWSDGWRGLTPNRGKRQRRDMMAVLALLPRNESHPVQGLLDNGRAFMKSGTTPVLLTPREMQLGLGESARGEMVLVSAGSPQAVSWFHFDSRIDFTRCAPLEPERKTIKRNREQLLAGTEI